MRYEKYKNSRNWAVYDNLGQLVCVTLYRKGAQEVVRRLSDSRECVSPSPCSSNHEILKLVKDIKNSGKKLQQLTTELLPKING
ncbi:MAG TPA: hypothetical protein VEF53_10055 [Patescibacteria group bacterium]|nr:hypothetical protein [Patescibacteria group bacterium]